MEIGSPAINILIDTWEGHLTPQEVASLADRASRCRDASMVRAAAELALSCLPHAQVSVRIWNFHPIVFIKSRDDKK